MSCLPRCFMSSEKMGTEKAKGDKYDAFTFMVVDMLKFSEFCEFT